MPPGTSIPESQQEQFLESPSLTTLVVEQSEPLPPSCITFHERLSLGAPSPRSVCRTAVGNELTSIYFTMEDEVIEVCHLSFLRDYAPFNPSDEDVRACFDVLLEAGLVTQEDGRYEVSEVNQSLSASISEPPSYNSLSTICESIAKAHLKGRSASCSLKRNLLDAVTSELSDSSDHSSNGYFKLLESTAVASTDLTTADCVVNCEWILDSCADNIVENRRSVARHAVRVMNEDPRRLFTYSCPQMTFEDTRMTLWYWSRSHCANSVPFDFTQDIFTTVRVLASFIFARTDELGFDTSIRRRLDYTDTKRKSCFVFRVQDRYFKTLHSISEHLNPRRVIGRSTRVFEVIEVGSFDDLTPIPGATNQILKDVWLDEEARTEKQIQDDIFKDLDAFSKKLQDEGTSELPQFRTGVPQGDEDILRTALRGANYKRYFLTIDCDQQRVLSRPHSLFTRPFPTAVPASLPYASSSRSHLTSVTLSQQPEDKVTRQPRDYVPKRQYRVVFNEVCEALQNVRELKTVIRGMQDCLTGLQLMFLAGWVHRDISGGNMLWFSEAEMQGRGILSDLEYAKKFDANGQGSADPKTDTQGTPFFMAIEIQRQSHIYRPRKAVGLEELPSRITIKHSKSLLMIHNFEHDLESLFWVLLWTITVRGGNESTQRRVGLIFQQDSHCSREREEVITAGSELVEELEGLVPQELKEFLGYIEVFSFVLMDSYLTREFKLGDLSTYSGLYGLVRQLLSQCLGVAERLDIPLLPLGLSRQDTQAKEVHALVPQTRKRTRAPTKAEAGSASRKSQRISKNAKSTRGRKSA
ncbi:hypothetical protein EVG20_g10608 [Dentipellis fragilis]|uniref:Fungal-type protein kinase domain-containing protein n=1 Tax=Dentipellis fragilis TaxID=205917 RepID=A0A4Y9XUS7_9AGAM|nr:hypothetical protein EVG20_g10608 [Dentipellis fragilis]